MQVQVISLTNVQSGTRAGLMLRTGTDAGAQMIFVGSTASDGYRFNYRTTANAVGSFAKYGSVAYPNAWVRLVRQGNIFTGYYSTDGVNWTKMQSLTMTLPATLDLGLAVCSHTNAQTATATFRHYNLTLAAAPANPGNPGNPRGDPSTTPSTQPPATTPPARDSQRRHRPAACTARRRQERNQGAAQGLRRRSSRPAGRAGRRSSIALVGGCHFVGKGGQPAGRSHRRSGHAFEPREDRFHRDRGR